MTGGPAGCGEGGERGRADGGGDQLSQAERTDDLSARGGEHPFPLLSQVSSTCFLLNLCTLLNKKQVDHCKCSL